MTYKPYGTNEMKEAYTRGYTDAQYLGEHHNTYKFITQSVLYEQYENGFNDWFGYVNDDEYSYQRVQTTLRGWCTR